MTTLKLPPKVSTRAVSSLVTSMTNGLTDAAYERRRIEEALSGVIAALTAADIANTPAGSIAATDVQSAIDELDAEKQPLDADLTAIAAEATTAYGRSLLTTASVGALIASLVAGGLSNGVNLQVHTTSETHTPHTDAVAQIVFVTGGGGGGGSGNTSNQSRGGGGGAGATAIALITSPASVSVTVGAGGTSTTTTSGTAGGQSAFGTITANGGGGGQEDNSRTGAEGGAGSATTANAPLSLPGGDGVGGYADSGTGGTGHTGIGGASFWGGGGGSTGALTGNNGQAPGSGGGGGRRSGGGTDGAGGSGADGIVVVLEWLLVTP